MDNVGHEVTRQVDSTRNAIVTIVVVVSASVLIVCFVACFMCRTAVKAVSKPRDKSDKKKEKKKDKDDTTDAPPKPAQAPPPTQHAQASQVPTPIIQPSHYPVQQTGMYPGQPVFTTPHAQPAPSGGVYYPQPAPGMHGQYPAYAQPVNVPQSPAAYPYQHASAPPSTTAHYAV